MELTKLKTMIIDLLKEMTELKEEKQKWEQERYELVDEIESTPVYKIQLKEEALCVLNSDVRINTAWFENFADDKEVMLKIAETHGGFVMYTANNELKNDPDVIEAAVNNGSSFYEDATETLDDDSLLLLINRRRLSLENIHSKHRDKEEIVLACLKNSLYEFEYAADRIKEMVGENDPIITLQNIIDRKKLNTKFENLIDKEQKSKFADVL